MTDFLTLNIQDFNFSSIVGAFVVTSNRNHQKIQLFNIIEILSLNRYYSMILIQCYYLVSIVVHTFHSIIDHFIQPLFDGTIHVVPFRDLTPFVYIISYSVLLTSFHISLTILLIVLFKKNFKQKCN